jgi:hypothetical protein
VGGSSLVTALNLRGAGGPVRANVPSRDSSGDRGWVATRERYGGLGYAMEAGLNWVRFGFDKLSSNRSSAFTSRTMQDQEESCRSSGSRWSERRHTPSMGFGSMSWFGTAPSWPLPGPLRALTITSGCGSSGDTDAPVPRKMAFTGGGDEKIPVMAELVVFSRRRQHCDRRSAGNFIGPASFCGLEFVLAKFIASVMK